MLVNLTSSIVVFALQIAINFFLTPYILRSLGDEAYGFLMFAISLVNYGYIFTIAINSVSARFVAQKYHISHLKSASQLYSSVLGINIIFSLITVLLSLVLVLNLESFVSLSSHLEFDVKLTIFLYFMNFCLGLFSAVFNISAFLKDKIYISSLQQGLSIVIFASLLWVLFFTLKAMIFYTALSALVASIFVCAFSYKLSKKLTPDLKLDLFSFKFSSLFALLRSGAWNTLGAISRTLLMSMDLVLCNALISPAAMGILSVSKMAPLMTESLGNTINYTFLSHLTKLHLEGRTKTLLSYIKFNTKILALLAGVPAVVFGVFGYEFFALWLDFKTTKEIGEIYSVCMLYLSPVVLLIIVLPFLSLGTVTNKLGALAKANMAMAFISIFAQFVVLKFGNASLQSMAFVAAFIYISKIICFDIANAGLSLGLKFSAFYGRFFLNLAVLLLCFVFLLAFRELASLVLKFAGWGEFFVVSGAGAVMAFVFCFFMLFDAREKQIVYLKALAIIKTIQKRKR